MVNGLFLQPIAFIPLYRKRKRSSIKKKKVNSLNIAVTSHRVHLRLYIQGMTAESSNIIIARLTSQLSIELEKLRQAAITKRWRTDGTNYS